jgi:heterotetrameric sarcosine oxidase gamma subunit
MTTAPPLCRSPIANGLTLGNAQFQLADHSGAPVILIQGKGDDLLTAAFVALPGKPGDLVNVGEGWLARLTPTQLYLFGSSPTATLPTAAVLDASFRQAGRFAHATDLTGGTAILRLAGDATSVVLSKLCALDFHPTRFPNLYVAQTSVAKIKTLIARHDAGETPVYSLQVDAPSAQYLWDSVLDAGREFFSL